MYHIVYTYAAYDMPQFNEISVHNRVIHWSRDHFIHSFLRSNVQPLYGPGLRVHNVHFRHHQLGHGQVGSGDLTRTG